jgi:translation initiation factor IF-2
MLRGTMSRRQQMGGGTPRELLPFEAAARAAMDEAPAAQGQRNNAGPGQSGRAGERRTDDAPRFIIRHQKYSAKFPGQGPYSDAGRPGPIQNTMEQDDHFPTSFRDVKVPLIDSGRDRTPPVKSQARDAAPAAAWGQLSRRGGDGRLSDPPGFVQLSRSFAQERTIPLQEERWEQWGSWSRPRRSHSREESWQSDIRSGRSERYPQGQPDQTFASRDTSSGARETQDNFIFKGVRRADPQHGGFRGVRRTKGERRPENETSTRWTDDPSWRSPVRLETPAVLESLDQDKGRQIKRDVLESEPADPAIMDEEIEKEVVAQKERLKQVQEKQYQDEDGGRRRGHNARDGRRREDRASRSVDAWPEEDGKVVRASRKNRSRGRSGRSSQEDDLDDFYDEEVVESRRQRKAERRAREAAEAALGVESTPIVLPQFISVQNLAVALGLKLDMLLSQLTELGFENIYDESIMVGETAALVAQEYGFEPTVDSADDVDLKPRPAPQDASSLPSRPPVVTIMGHVDHGKTTILDWLRKSSIAAGEHGGITQHIGAFTFALSHGRQITFLDTPGHAAFLSMRQRGANVTDIVVLVVAADDSVKPQTLEALRHARAARVPIIVAINKVDKEEARIEEVKQDLARNGVEIEDYGGDVQVVPVSGKTGQGMADLEENIFTLSEILDHRAETDGMAEGWVLESSTKPIGRVATILVKRGTLRKGDIILAGTVYTKIRLLRNEAGDEVAEALPGTAAEVLGWKDAPEAGDQVLQAPDENTAKAAAIYRESLGDQARVVAEMDQSHNKKERAVTDFDHGNMADGTDKEKERAMSKGGIEVTSEADAIPSINFSVKADVAGSVEAVVAALGELGNNEIRAKILRSGAGQINESDIEHASVTGSAIINFGNDIPGAVRGMADVKGIRIIDHSVIYHLVDEVKEMLSEKLAPFVTQKVLGEAEVAQVFPINLNGRRYKNIAGCKVRNGSISRTAMVRLMRFGQNVFTGEIISLL